MAAETTVEGLADLKRKLDRLPRDIRRKAIRSMLRGGAKVLQKQAVALAPVGTETTTRRGRTTSPGNLARSIYIRWLKRDYSMHVLVSRRAYYWIFPEFGTAKQPARPFMRPAFESRKIAAVGACRDSLARYLKRWARKNRAAR